MGKFLRYGLSVAALFAFLSFDIGAGDLRYNLGSRTVRHWKIVPVSIRLNEACAIPKSGGFPCGSSVAGSYTLSGPGTGTINQATSNFTVQGSGVTSALVTPNDNSHGGVFNPATVNLSNTNPINFNYTPLQAGSYNINTTNGGGLTDPPAKSFNVPNLSAGYPGLSTGWSTNNDSSLSSGQPNDPFSGSLAAIVTEGTGVGSYHSIIGTGFTITNGQSYTVSLIVKRGTGTRNVDVQFVDTGFLTGDQISVDIPTCTISNPVGWAGSTISSTATRTANLGSGWCLAQMVGTLNTSSAVLQIFMTSGGVQQYNGDGASSVLLYGPVVQ